MIELIGAPKQRPELAMFARLVRLCGSLALAPLMALGCGDDDDGGTGGGAGGGFSAEPLVDCNEYDSSSLELVARGCACDFSGQDFCCRHPRGSTFRCIEGTWWAAFSDDYCNMWPGADGGVVPNPPPGVAATCELDDGTSAAAP